MVKLFDSCVGDLGQIDRDGRKIAHYFRTTFPIAMIRDDAVDLAISLSPSNKLPSSEQIDLPMCNIRPFPTSLPGLAGDFPNGLFQCHLSPSAIAGNSRSESHARSCEVQIWTTGEVFGAPSSVATLKISSS